MSQRHERQELKKSLNMKDIMALAFGTMIGWGWIMLAGKWVGAAGVLGAILAFGFGAILCIFVGLTYAELTPALPIAGGELVFSYRGLGFNLSWVTGWMITFAYIGVAAWEGPALATAIEFLFGDTLPKGAVLWNIAGFDVTSTFLIIGALGGLILAFVNYRGAKASAIFQTAATLAMTLGGLAFLFGGVVKGDIGNMLPMMTDGKGFVAVILMVPAMFVGFDVIPQAAEEMNIPLNKIAKVLIISICMAAIWYMLMIFSIAISAPAAIRDGASIPVADSFAYCMGHPVFGKLMIIAAMCGILTSWNGFIVGGTRVLFSMGRAKMIPEIFAKVHPKYKSPVAAVILVGIITCTSPLLGKGALVWFVNASAFGTVIAYLMVACSFISLRIREPELERPYKIKGGIPVGIIAVVVALFFLSLYLPIYSPSPLVGIEWALVGGWIVLGAILYIIKVLKNKTENVSKGDIEYLMFGDEYKRF